MRSNLLPQRGSPSSLKADDQPHALDTQPCYREVTAMSSCIIRVNFALLGSWLEFVQWIVTQCNVDNCGQLSILKMSGSSAGAAVKLSLRVSDGRDGGGRSGGPALRYMPAPLVSVSRPCGEAVGEPDCAVAGGGRVCTCRGTAPARPKRRFSTRHPISHGDRVGSCTAGSGGRRPVKVVSSARDDVKGTCV